jgi:glutamate carboxypeptidase
MGIRMVEAQTREQLVAFAEQHAAEQLQFLIDLSRQNSYTYNKAGTDRVADLILQKIGDLFPSHRIAEQTNVGDHHVLSNSADAKSICVLGHMDTVFPPDHPFRDCWLEEDRLHGPGTGDMKAGLATIVYAVLALKEAGVLDTIPLTIMLGGDEEVGSITSRPVYESERGNALACLVIEGAGLAGEIVVSRNGKMGVRLECHGQDRHVGSGTHEKSSAVLELAHKTIALEALNGTLPGVSLNVGKIEGGLGPATIPAHANALLDVRWVEQAHRDVLVEKIGAVVSTADRPGCRSEFTILNERAAMPEIGTTRQLAGLVQRAGAALGQTIGLEHRRGTSDANFFGSFGVPTVDGIGPICKGYHTPEEFVFVSSIKQRTALLATALVSIGLHFAGNG